MESEEKIKEDISELTIEETGNKTVQDYLDLYKQKVDLEKELALEKKDSSNLLKKTWRLEEELRNLKYDSSKTKGGLSAIFFIILTICCFVCLFMGGCVNGCSANEDHYVNPPVIVTSVSSDFRNSNYSVYETNSRHVIFRDKRGKYNVGDTIKFAR